MLRIAVLTFGACLLAVQGYADFDFSLDTSQLVGNGAGPFALDFQLTSGDTTSGVVNTATLSLFSFGAGGNVGAGSPFPNSGNASGDLGSTVALSTSGGSFFNEFSQYFMPGGLLQFQLDITNNQQPSGTPDEFTFQLIDNTLGEVPTTDPSGSNSLVIIDLTGATLQPQVYTTNGDGVTITPQLSSPVSAVPEPSSFYLLLPVMCVTLVYLKRARTGVTSGRACR